MMMEIAIAYPISYCSKPFLKAYILSDNVELAGPPLVRA